jgi:hypothetical protein
MCLDLVSGGAVDELRWRAEVTHSVTDYRGVEKDTKSRLIRRRPVNSQRSVNQ